MVSDKQTWREKAEGELEDIEYFPDNTKFNLRYWYRLFWAIGAALVSISHENIQL